MLFRITRQTRLYNADAARKFTNCHKMGLTAAMTAEELETIKAEPNGSGDIPTDWYTLATVSLSSERHLGRRESNEITGGDSARAGGGVSSHSFTQREGRVPSPEAKVVAASDRGEQRGRLSSVHSNTDSAGRSRSPAVREK